jgi:polyphosphate glucokinase
LIVNVLAVDVGGTNVKILASGASEARRFPSGPGLTPRKMVAGVKKLARGWDYSVVSIGYPGLIIHNTLIAEPHNLAPGWVGFDFAAAFGCRVKVLNDAAMQALGSYDGGRMLFLGLGTGLGTALIDDGELEPMELAHVRYKKRTYEDYVGARAQKEFGKKKWRKNVAEVVANLRTIFEPTDIVLGGGNVKQLKELPEGCRQGCNANAFTGGFRMWERDAT